MPSLTFTTDWFTKRIPQWEQYLKHVAGLPNLRFLEIGSWEGMSACWLLQNILTDPSARLTCIDFFRPCDVTWVSADGAPMSPPVSIDAEKHFDENIRTIGATARVIKLAGDSKEILRSLPVCHYDFVYIDGSHDARDVLRDSILSWDLLKNGGIVIFDDYLWMKNVSLRKMPRYAIDAFLQIFEEEYDLLHMHYQVILRKKMPFPQYPQAERRKTDLFVSGRIHGECTEDGAIRQDTICPSVGESTDKAQGEEYL